jgi:FixJ family two-component response regulator
MPTAEQYQPTVFVVDDDEQLRESLCTLLKVLNFEVRAFSTPGSFHRYYRAEMPGCLLLDLRMPRQSGLELYEQLLSEGKRLPVIFITAHADVTSAVAAMKSGAVEFLEKPFDRETLLDRVLNALKLDAEWREQEARLNALSSRIARLSDRERETLALIQSGASNKEMASRLYVSERAVEMRRSAIMRKLQVSSVAELLDLTITHRILSDLRAVNQNRGRTQAIE